MDPLDEFSEFLGLNAGSSLTTTTRTIGSAATVPTAVPTATTEMAASATTPIPDATVTADAPIDPIHALRERLLAENANKVRGSSKLDKRRDSHREVERRRRELINAAIEEISGMLPRGPVPRNNKGEILIQAIEHIRSLHLRVAEYERDREKWRLNKALCEQALTDLSTDVERLSRENARLKDQLNALRRDVLAEND